MNKQGKLINSKVVGGIEWTKWILPDGTERPGYSWNAIGGCLHGCRWTMPDSSIAICYAEDTAEGVAREHYPQGFEHHYFHPDRLVEPLRVKQPARIFLDSMADLLGHWVPDEQVEAVLDVCRRAHWHAFQLLTKNAPRLLKFRFPSNVWVGASTPPDFMFGKPLSLSQKDRMLHRTLDILARVAVPVRWCSVEPLSWDVASIFSEHAPLQWAVIGAASNGPVKYQPDPGHVQGLLDVFDRQGCPVFFKGNLRWTPWREGFPNHAEKWR